MSFLDNLKSKASSAVKKYSPDMLSPDRRYAKGIIVVCALLTMADGEAEDSEIEASYQFINGIDIITQHLSAEESSEIFRSTLELLDTAHKLTSAHVRIQENALISGIVEGISDPEFRQNVALIAETMARSNSRDQQGPEESALIELLKIKLGVS